MKICACLAIIAGLTGVALGAFGAHAFKDQLVASGHTATWNTAVLYQLVHAVATLTVCLPASLAESPDALNRSVQPSARPWLRRVAIYWLAGILLFSGSLYILALGGPRWLGPVTPVGGVALIAGWALLLVALVVNPRRPTP